MVLLESSIKSKQELVQALLKMGINADLMDWENFMGTVKSPGSVVIDIASEQQAIEAMKLIYASNLEREELWSVRAVAGWRDKPATCPVRRFFKNLCQPVERYNESYTANPSTSADIIFRFGTKFQSISMIGEDTVEVSAGVQTSQFESFLAKKHRSVPTWTMINKVTPIGALMNGCQGTGTNQPTISGLVTKVRVLKPNGEIIELDSSHQDFPVLMGANLGLMGIILSAQFRTEPQFLLEEQVAHYTCLNELREHVEDWLKHEYFTAMLTPQYGIKEIDNSVIPHIQVRVWDRTNAKITHPRNVHNYTPEDIIAELGAQAGGQLQTLLLRLDMRQILEVFMALTAMIIAVERREDERVASANNMMHYQRSFPSQLSLVSFQLSVPDNEIASRMMRILEHGEQVLSHMNSSPEQSIPVTYATYVRLIDGTSGGLSTCPKKPSHKVLIIEYVTHPNAPGFQEFIRQMQDFYHDNDWHGQFHLGKELPESIADFIDASELNALSDALVRWHGDWQHAFERNPMFNAFLKNQFNMPMTEREQQTINTPQPLKAEIINDRDAAVILQQFAKKLHGKKFKHAAEQQIASQLCELCESKAHSLVSSETFGLST